MGEFIGIALVVILISYWISTFCSLMAMPDSDFLGRNDKLIWAILVIVTFAVGASMFHLWRFCQRPVGYAEEELVQISASASQSIDTHTETTQTQ